MAVKALYTEQVIALVSLPIRRKLEAEADARDVSLAQIVREALDARYPDEADG